MKYWSRKNKVLIGLLILFFCIQAVQPSRNKGSVSGPKDIAQVLQVPDTVLAMLNNSCYDCHSNRTVYPWYGSISPLNWWLAFHVEEGKQELNFTLFGDYSGKWQSETLVAIAETVQTGEMPQNSYLLMRSEAKLTAAQKELLIAWARNAQKEMAARQTP